MSNITSLPNSLILLVHLHLLNYPYANRPEYDDNLFSSAKGLRERTKTMEDISYFLVGRLERLRDGPKAFFPTYPCKKPSDTVAFRTSLAKYLEQLRHSSLYTAAAGRGPKQKDRPTTKTIADIPALWWKDVVIRKSLLEECVGERFERLMLALSTQTLLKLSKAPPVSDFYQELSRQPILYLSAQTRVNSLRQTWRQRASLLEHREEELAQLRTRHSDAGHLGSKFLALSAEQIQELAQSKRRHVQAAFWSSADERKALDLFVMLAGLVGSKTSSQSVLSVQDKPLPVPPLSFAPLPVAAAHHPSQLKKLRRPIFPTSGPQKEGKAPKSSFNLTGTLFLQPFLQAEATINVALSDALTRLRADNEQLTHVLQKHLLPPSSTHPQSPTFLGLFEDDLLDTLTKAAVNDLGLADDLASKLENRIEEIRTNVLLCYPIADDPLPARQPALEPSTVHQLGITQHPPLKDAAAPSARSPTKRSPRKSIRFSMARQSRPRVSTFRVFSGGEEVNQLINSTHDLPSDNEDSDFEDHFVSSEHFDATKSKPSMKDVRTPKSKQKVNRIWTASTPGARPPSTLKNSGLTSRESFPNFMEAAVSLPSLLSVEGFMDVSGGDNDDGDDGEHDGWYGGEGADKGDGLATPRAAEFNLDQSGDDYGFEDDDEYEESESMTLKEMLLSSSQGSFVDLMGPHENALDEEDIAADGSFNWDPNGVR